MSRNITTPAPVTSDVTDVTPDVTDATDTPDTFTPDADTYADPTADGMANIVDAYVRGAIRRDVARTFVMARVTACATSGDIAGMTTAGRIMAELDAATRPTARAARAFDVAPYVAATIARGFAMVDAGHAVLHGDTVPADVPDTHRDAFVAAVRDAVSGITATHGDVVGDVVDGYASARRVADTAGGLRVIGTASVPRHMALIASGDATDANGNPVTVTTDNGGTVFTMARVASFITSEYPAGVSRPNGAVTAQFRRDGVNRDVNVGGFVYAAPTGTRGHGVRFVGTPTV